MESTPSWRPESRVTSVQDKRDARSTKCGRGTFPTVQSHRLLRSWDMLVALGMLLSLQTQLRPNGSVVGPGELLLVVWMVPLFLLEIWRFQPKVHRAFWDLTRFWAVFALAESVGVFASIATTKLSDWSLVLHDIVAYLLLIALCGLLTVSPDAANRLRRIQWLTILFGSVLLLLQLANASGLISISGIDPWYWQRLRGWSENPNQLALECLLLGFLSLSCAEQSSRPAIAWVAIACASLAIGTGWLAKSNAFTIVVLGALILFAAMKAMRRIAQLERKGIPAFSLTVASCALLLLGLCLLAPFFQQHSNAVNSIKSDIARDNRSETNQELSLRLFLWKEALERGADSHMLGLGPGPHLEIPYAVLAGRRGGNEPVNLQHPKPELAPNFEAHNTTLELFVQGGVLAAGAFLSLCAVALWRAWQAGMDGLTTLLLASGAFGSFHVISRHPMIWFIISLALLARRYDATASASSGNAKRPLFSVGYTSIRPSPTLT